MEELATITKEEEEEGEVEKAGTTYHYKMTEENEEETIARK